MCTKYKDCDDASDYLNSPPLLFTTMDFCLQNNIPSFFKCNHDLGGYFFLIIRIISILIIVVFCVVLIWKRKRIATWIDNSIFAYFDDYKKESYEEIGIDDNSDEIGKNETKNNVYIFDFEKYCCQNCCDIWKKFIYEKIIKNCLKNAIIEPLKNILYKYRKNVSFFLVVFGLMIFRPLEYILSLFFANSCICSYNFSPIIFVFIDLFLSFFYTFNFYFLIAMICLRREIQRIDPLDKLRRAQFFHFTFLKGLYFGILVLIVKLLLIANTGRYFYEIGISSDFACYSLGRQLIFLSLLIKNFIKKKKAIKNNCNVLREVSTLNNIEDYIYKNSLGIETIDELIKQDDNQMENFREEIKKKIEEKKKHKICEVNKILEINEKQNFKNIIFKKSYSSNWPKFTTFLIFIDCLIVATVDIMVLLSITKNETDCNYQSAFLGISFVVIIIEQSMSAIFFFKTVDKKMFFG